MAMLDAREALRGDPGAASELLAAELPLLAELADAQIDLLILRLGDIGQVRTEWAVCKRPERRSRNLRASLHQASSSGGRYLILTYPSRRPAAVRRETVRYSN